MTAATQPRAEEVGGVMIIVEGMDNSGKTTLIDQLKKGFPELEVDKSPSRLVVEGRIHEWVQWIEWTLLPGQKFLLCDRHAIISEYVYGPVFRNINLLSTTDYLARLMGAGPLVIFCRPSDEAILKTTKPEMNGVIEHGPRLLRRYDHMFTSLADYNYSFSLLRYNWEKPGELSLVMRRVAAYLRGLHVLTGGA